MTAKLKKEYEKDFYAWTMHNAELIRKKRFSEMDFEHVAEEIEEMGKSHERSLASRFEVLIAHLLKWQFQSHYRCNSWRATIQEQRLRIKKLLKQNPSLKNEVDAIFSDVYDEAVLIAVQDTNLSEKTFPKKCPYSLEQCLKENYFPQ